MKVGKTWRIACIAGVAVLLLACVALACGQVTARADGLPVAPVETKWIYDGTSHAAVTVQEDYEGVYEVHYYAADQATELQAQEVVNAGTYYVVLTAEANGEYEAYASGFIALTVIPRPVSIVADDKAVEYTEVADLTATVLYGNATLGYAELPAFVDEGQAYTLICAADAGSYVGTYDIVPARQGAPNPNYDVTFVKGTCTVGKKQLTVSVDHAMRVYGEECVPLTYNDGEELQALTGKTAGGKCAIFELVALDGDDAVVATTPVGSYPVVGTNLRPDLYDITFENTQNAYTVTPRPITVQVTALSSAYGEATLPLAADDSQVLGWDKDVYRLSFAAEEVKDAGSYDVVGTALSDNYTITFEGTQNAYTILPRVVGLAWTGDECVYDGLPHLPTVRLTNVLEGDAITATLVGAATDAGRHTATVQGLDNPNYALPEVTSRVYVIQKGEATFDLSQAVVTFRYTGKAQSVSGATASGEVSYRDNTFVEVGSYVVTVLAAESDNRLAGETTLVATVLEAAPIVHEDGTATYYKIIGARAATAGVDVSAIFADAKQGRGEMRAEVGDITILFDAEAVASSGEENLLQCTLTLYDIEIYDTLPADTRYVLDVALAGFGGGTATVTLPFADEVSKGKVAKVYYVAEDGTMVDMNAVFADGTAQFETNHFSRYVILVEDKLSRGAVIGIVVGGLVLAAGVLFALYWLLLRKQIAAAKRTLNEDK